MRVKKDTPSVAAGYSTAAAVAATTVAVAGVGIAVASESNAKPDEEPEEVHHENGHQENGFQETEHPDTAETHEEVREIEVVEEPETAPGHADTLEAQDHEHEEVQEEQEQGLLEVDAKVEELLQSVTVDQPQEEEEQINEEVIHVQAPDTGTTSSSDTQVVSEELAAAETKPHLRVGDDIEDMVHLLESSIPKRPLSIVSIPDEVNEIPDEE
jgi:hypothetical protein